MKKFLTITFTILLLLISTSVYANTENWTNEGIYDATWFGDDYALKQSGKFGTKLIWRLFQ